VLLRLWFPQSGHGTVDRGEIIFAGSPSEWIRRLAQGEVQPVHTVALEVFAYAQGLNNATHARSRDS
jgi:hypothetical protein